MCVWQISTKSNKFQGKRASEEKCGRTKKHKIHEVLDLLGFRWKNIESGGVYENETLHIVTQLLPLCVCQISSKSNNFQQKKAGEEKVVKAKSTNFTRWSTYSDSQHKTLSQVELKKQKFCL